MTKIHLTDGRTVEYNNVTIKNSGWAKCYDDVSGSVGNKEYENLQHYPGHMIQNVRGDVTYESSHGRV